MPLTKVPVPRRLLLATDISASAKLVWMWVRLKRHRSARRLQAQSGLAATTIRPALTALKRADWFGTHAASREPVFIPAELLLDRQVTTTGKLLYAILQSGADYELSGPLHYTRLAALAGMSLNTVKTGIRRLRQAGWLRVVNSDEFRGMKFTLLNPADDRFRRVVAGIERRSIKAHKGEQLMREQLSLIIASEHYEDDASPGFLVNPYTGEEMQLDRYYPLLCLAFEFQGAQHNGPTERYPDPDEARKQQARDHMKAGICKSEGIDLVLIHPEDLRFKTLRDKVPAAVPLRDLSGEQRLIAYLDRRSGSYREKSSPAAPHSLTLPGSRTP